MEWIKNIIVRWFFRFKVARTSTGRYRVAFRPPFGEWAILAGGVYAGRAGAERRILELKREGGWLLDILDDGADY